MNRQWVGCLMGCLVLTTAGGYAFSLVAATPEEALSRPFSCPSKPEVEAKNFQVLTIRKWSKGIVAVYRGLCPVNAKQSFSKDRKNLEQVLSYRAVNRNRMEWHLSSTGSYRSQIEEKGKPASAKLVDYGVNWTGGKGNDRHAVLYGQVISPQVSAIEATFNNGKSLRDESPDGLFALVAPGATGICDIRVFGYDNQILQREELLSPKKPAARDGNTCQPISGQL